MDDLVVFVNGKKITVSKADPEVTLAHFLRDKCGLKGTKIGCNEGGCGACTVMVSHYDRKSAKPIHYAVNSCLLSLAWLHGKAVTTVEGVGNTATKLHPIQSKLANSHGTQCGFCSPGMVMSMYALLRNEPRPTQQQIENCLIGNYCRCTGYRPIIDGFYEFSSASPCALGQNCCKNQGNTADATNAANTTNAASNTVGELSPDYLQDYIFPPELKVKDYHSAEKCYKGERVTWYQPASVARLLELKAQFPKAKVVCAQGVGNNLSAPLQDSTIISTSNIQELSGLREATPNGIQIGSATTISQFWNILSDMVEQLPESQSALYKTILADVRSRFACRQVINVASLVGNLLIPVGQSDLTPVCVAAGAVLSLRSVNKSRSLLVTDKLFPADRKSFLADDEVVESLFFPHSAQGEFIRFYKQGDRKSVTNSIVNAAYRVQFTDSKVSAMSIVYGGLPFGMAKAFPQTSQSLIGREWNEKLLEEGVASLTAELNSATSDLKSPDSLTSYQKTLVTSLFYKFYSDVAEKLSTGKFPEVGQYTAIKGKQLYDDSPVATSSEVSAASHCFKPVPHRSADLHVTGEATYVDDMPPYADELHMAVVYSEVAHAKIVSIDTSEALNALGVRGYVSAEDVPGSNVCGLIGEERVFYNEKVESVGQILGGIVADTLQHAQIAAGLVKVEYEKLPPILTIKDAISAKSFFNPQPMMLWKGKDMAEAFSGVDMVMEGEMEIGGQEHFYMEPQVTRCVPKENGEIDVFSSTQSPKFMQDGVGKALGIPFSKTNINVKRLGGGFGGKSRKPMLSGVPAAVAANKFRVPVRCTLERKEDMVITGGRDPALIKYKVGYNKDGRIKTLDAEIYTDAGCTLDLAILIVQKAMYHLENCYNIENMRVKGWACKTNHPSNTACRALAAPHAVLVIEHILEEISAKLNIPRHVIQQLNFCREGHTTVYGQVVSNCTLERCYNQVVSDSDFVNRQQAVKQFNLNNKWRKRGIELTPIMYGIAFDTLLLNQATSLVHIYVDGSVLITHGGTEMGQGIHTKLIQLASNSLGISIDKVHLQDVSTVTVPNSTVTAASVNTDINGGAVLNACEKLNKRLEAFKQKMPNASWEEWVTSAYVERVSLSAQGFYSTPGLVPIDWSTSKGSPYQYYVFGAAVSEVEIDCLTGHHQVLRTDVVMDAGVSINPAIDVGQIEGAFIQGYGLYCLEELQFDESGVMTTVGPATYKIPLVDNIPREFNVSLLKNSSNPGNVASSKGVGEAPLPLAVSIFMAIKSAVRSARRASGKDESFTFSSPCTPERIRMSCADQFIATA